MTPRWAYPPAGGFGGSVRDWAEALNVMLMDLEIVPEPSPEERRAIVLGPEEDDQAAAPVRQSRGAARA